MKKVIMVFALILCAALFYAFGEGLKIEKLSFSMNAKVLRNGKYVASNGQVYYVVAGGKMVTHFNKPEETIVFTNAKGEYKIYNVGKNTLLQDQSVDFSSRNSFIYSFLSGGTQDLGLRKDGYTVVDTKIEEEMVITTWVPPANRSQGVGRVTMAHENYLPTFMGFTNDEGDPLQKVYYSKYQKIGTISMPMAVTEIAYFGEGDSSITRRVYSNLKINEQVSNTYLNYQIPADVKVVK